MNKSKKKYKQGMIGQRILKSALAVFVCQMIYLLRGVNGIPFYATIAALQSIQQNRKSGYKVGKNRVLATFLGGFWGLLFCLLKVYVPMPEPYCYYVDYIVIALMIICVIKSAIWVRLADVSYFACVVYLSIVITHLGDEDPYLFVISRIVDTLIGVVVALVIDAIHIPTKTDKDTLFVSGLDEILLDETGVIPKYASIEVNRMIEDGMQFTIATSRTLSSAMDKIKPLDIELPIVCYDGALLFDGKDKNFLKIEPISMDVVRPIRDIMEQEEHCCYITTLCQETIIVYYTKFYQDIEEAIYKKHRVLPYCNYMQGQMHADAQPIYMMAIGTPERIATLYRRLKKEEFAKEVRMERVKSDQDPNDICLKIYHRDANKKKMIQELCKVKNITNNTLLGTRGILSDVPVEDSQYHHAIQTLKKEFRKNGNRE
ncbi:MAG: HAD hydrolase family protein [Eubacteriales bacterium]